MVQSSFHDSISRGLVSCMVFLWCFLWICSTDSWCDSIRVCTVFWRRYLGISSFCSLWNIWVKVFKNGPSKICGRQSLKNLKRYALPKQTTEKFLKATFHKFTWSILECLDSFSHNIMSSLHVLIAFLTMYWRLEVFIAISDQILSYCCCLCFPRYVEFILNDPQPVDRCINGQDYLEMEITCHTRIFHVLMPTPFLSLTDWSKISMTGTKAGCKCILCCYFVMQIVQKFRFFHSSIIFIRYLFHPHDHRN